jgi:hypothetical protein
MAEFNRGEFKKVMAGMRENVDEFQELLVLQADRMRMKYDSLLKSGFSPTDALYIVAHAPHLLQF